MKKSFLFIFLISVFVLLSFVYGNRNKNLDTYIKEVEISQKEYEVKGQVTVPILVYHNIRDFRVGEPEHDREFVVSAKNFEKQMKYLNENNFQTILMRDLYSYFEGEKDLPKNPVIITFDDGVLNQYESAFPVLKKYGQIATFFVFTNAMDRNDNYINWVQLAEMVDGGMEIGSHTNLHPFLTKLKSDAEFEKEIVFSKSEIKKYLDYDVMSFAYPFGEYNEEIIVRLQSAGYTSARGIVDGSEHTIDDLFKLKSYFSTSNFDRFKKIIN